MERGPCFSVPTPAFPPNFSSTARRSIGESVKADNILTMLGAGRDNIDFTRYLIGQVLHDLRTGWRVLKGFVLIVKRTDWWLEVAGQRVQIIKKQPVRGGACNLVSRWFPRRTVHRGAPGASPGASTSLDHA